MMGDRGVAVVGFEDGTALAIYTHWGGDNLLLAASEAATYAECRAGDEPYFARMFVDRFTREGRDSEYGYGLTALATLKGFDPEAIGGDYPWYVLVDAQTAEVTAVARMGVAT